MLYRPALACVTHEYPYSEAQRKLDEDLVDTVRGVVQVDRAVRRYRHRLSVGMPPLPIRRAES
jgi:hypothetical protein